MPLGRLLGPSQAVFDGIEAPKPQNAKGVVKVFTNAGFRYLEALDGPLGRILVPLGPIWSRKGSQNGPKSGPNTGPKDDPKNDPQNT